MPVNKWVRFGAIAAVLALFQAGAAQAITLADPEIVQAIRPDEAFGATFWNFNTTPFTAVSAVNGSQGSVSTVLGQSPTIAGEVTTGTTGYVSASNKLTYQLAYFNPSGTHDLLNVNVQAFDTLLAQGSNASTGYFRSYAWSQLSLVGPASDVLYTRYHCTSASSTLGYEPCGGGANAPIAPFTVNLQQNTIYTVTMQLYAAATANSNNSTAVGTASALLDPTFNVISAAPVGGSFIYSAGVSPVPEPEAWAMLMAGLACVAGVARRRRTFFSL